MVNCKTICPWHFKESILAREIEKLKSGIKFVFPLPEINIISYDDIINN